MSPWSKRVLIATMVVWSALTLGAGWYALRGNSGSAQAARGAQVTANSSTGGKPMNAAAATGTLVAASAASNVDGSLRSTSTVADASGATTAGANASNATPAPSSGNAGRQRPPLSLQPVPANAASAGASSRTQSLDHDGPHTAPARAASKGVIVLDPGHGRGDPGAVHHLSGGASGVDMTEADSNLRNAELMRDDLVAMGYDVYLTRNGEGAGPGVPLPLQFITSDLYARVGLAKAVDANLYLAIHGNGASVPFLSGPETWYCGRRQEGAASEKLAGMVQRAMMDALHEYGYFPPDRGIKEDAATHHSGDFCQFVVTRETPVPAALLEFLFLTNDDDAKVLLDDQSHVLMARHVAAAIDQFMQERAKP